MTTDIEKLKKYQNKIKSFEDKMMFDNETKNKIITLVNDMSYLLEIIDVKTKKNPYIGLDMYGYSNIVFRAGDKLYRFKYYSSSLILNDNSEQEILMDRIDDMCKKECSNVDLTKKEYENLIKNQIILAFFYRFPECVESLNLENLDTLNKFTRSIITITNNTLNNKSVKSV